MKPRVSVIVPVYDGEALVAEAIESVLAQSYRDLEVLVVDDGSNDGTRAVVEARFGAEPRVRAFHKENGGAASARNLGLEHARGEFIGFLDHDDLYLPRHIESQLKALEAAPDAQMVVCDARWPYDDAPTVCALGHWRLPSSIDALFAGAFALPAMTLVRGDVARELRFDPGSFIEDTEFLFRFVEAGHRCVGNPEVLAVYRPRARSKTANRRAVMRAEADLYDRYLPQASRPRRVAAAIHQRRALLLIGERRWREARPHLWRWWRNKPDSVRALRYGVRSYYLPPLLRLLGRPCP